MSILIFTHGFDVNQPHWEKVVWGEPPHLLGRATHALYLAHRYFKDVRLGFGSGGTKREHNGTSLLEAAYTRAFLRDNLYRLTDFERFEDLGFFSRRRLGRLLDNAIIEVKCHNTYTESENIMPRVLGGGYDGVVVVSDKAHTSRCMLHGAQSMEKHGYVGKFDLFAAMSAAPNADQTAASCVALEPGLDDSNPMGDIVKGYWGLPNDQKPACIARFNEVIGALRPAT